MKDNLIKEQLLKLFEGKVILVLDEDDLEPLILAAVPALRIEADELLEDPSFANRLVANKLQRLANSLHALPKIGEPRIAYLGGGDN